MDQNAGIERDGIISDLTHIIRELEELSMELRRLRGIGAEDCSAKLIKLAKKYGDVRSLTYRI